MCPRTHFQVMLWRLHCSSSNCHRSAFFTGFLAAVFQPRFFQLTIHSVMPFITYCESVTSNTSQGRLSSSRPRIAPINSMRLLVVLASPPQSSFSMPLQTSKAPQPPGPGLPLQAPSVNSSTLSLMPIYPENAVARRSRIDDARGRGKPGRKNEEGLRLAMTTIDLGHRQRDQLAHRLASLLTHGPQADHDLAGYQ